MRLDRLVRGVANTQKVIAVAKQYRCRIVTYWNDIDFDTAVGSYQINMEAVHGKYELDIISERTRMEMIGAVEQDLVAAVNGRIGLSQAKLTHV